MRPAKRSQALVAVFPLDATTLVARFLKPLSPTEAKGMSLKLKSGLRVRGITLDKDDPRRVVARTSRMQATPIVVDTATVALSGATLDRARRSVRFAHAVLTPMELKVPNTEPGSPFRSTLTGVHVSVECCTGCNGGVHGRNLVVLNSHIGGPWTAVWVQTDKTIEAPYPRWQKVRCAGGVVADLHGSTTVVDKGWMEVTKDFETPHHAPPPLSLDARDMPSGKESALLARSLDGSWIELSTVTVKSARAVEGAVSRGVKDLPHNVVTLVDRSGGEVQAWMYQPSGLKLAVGARLSFLRGFVHIERSGICVILSDKEEDLGR